MTRNSLGKDIYYTLNSIRGNVPLAGTSTSGRWWNST
jgi:hypothetical protein